MRSSAVGGWLAVGLLLGCGAAPGEVVGVYQGQDSSSGQAASEGPSGGVDSGSTGSVADGSASSGTSTPPGGDGTTTAPVDPSTTDPDATTSGEPPGSTGPGSTSSEPGSSSEGGPPPTCQEVFGTAEGYISCTEAPGSCAFNVNVYGASCNTLCGMFGHGCIDSINNPGLGDGNECFDQGGEYDCNSVGKDTTICVCAL